MDDRTAEAGGAVEVAVRSKSHFRGRLFAVRKMKIEQSGHGSVGGDFEQGAKAKVRSTEPGGTIKNAIVALNQASYGIGSIGIVEREQSRQGSGRRHPENRSCGVASAVHRRPIKISVL